MDWAGFEYPGFAIELACTLKLLNTVDDQLVDIVLVNVAIVSEEIVIEMLLSPELIVKVESWTKFTFYIGVKLVPSI